MTDPRYMRPGVEFAVGKVVEEIGELQSELAKTQNDLGKLQAALGKTLRWGWEGVNPELPPSEQESNLLWVRRELQSVRLRLNEPGVAREMRDVRDAVGNLENEIHKNFL